MLMAIFLALVFCHSLVSGRLERSILTAPIVFTTTCGGRRASLQHRRTQRISIESLIVFNQ